MHLKPFKAIIFIKWHITLIYINNSDSRLCNFNQLDNATRENLEGYGETIEETFRYTPEGKLKTKMNLVPCLYLEVELPIKDIKDSIKEMCMKIQKEDIVLIKLKSSESMIGFIIMNEKYFKKKWKIN